MEGPPVEHLVLDSGAFIRNAPIREIGANVYTIGDVVNEIRDKATRQRLQVLPYELHFREPPPEDIKYVSDFAKKTGDYPSLSAVDLRVIALVYQLEKEKKGTEHIKTEPEKKISWNTTRKNLDKATDIAGFYLGPKKPAASGEGESVKEDGAEESTDADVTDIQKNVEATKCENLADTGDRTKSPSIDTVPSGVCQGVSDIKINNNPDRSSTDTAENVNTESVDKCSTSQVKGQEVTSDGVIENPRTQDDVTNSDIGTVDVDLKDDDDDGICDDEEEDDDDDGWITPGNIKEIKTSMKDDSQEKVNVTVACLTTDFAVQNVLIQMGLNVVSVEGLLIKRAKSYALRCYSCMKVTTIMTKTFCPNCGNKTLKRVTMTVNDDGSIQYFLSTNKSGFTRGMKYSLPAPQGGKHSSNPVLCEDQKEAQQRSAKFNDKFDVFDPDYIARNSPFALIDTTSRSAQLGIRNNQHSGRSRKNPNAVKKNYGRRK